MECRAKKENKWRNLVHLPFCDYIIKE